MEDFLVKFKNLKLLAKISNGHAMEILQLNVVWKTMKQFVYLYGPPASYNGLKANLLDLGQSENYIKAICCPAFNTPFHPYVPVF